MKKLKIYLIAAIAATFVFTACDEEDKIIEELEEQNPIPGPVTGDAGDLNFAKYVALGNSITAGFQDNALYDQGQALSFPALFAQQLETPGIEAGDFNQPDINSLIGFSGVRADGGINGRFELSLSLLRPVPNPNGEQFGAYTGDKSALSNFGVPGMRVVDVADPALASNPYYARFATQPGTSTVLGDVLGVSPTFFTYWLGNNDILGYAVGGGSNDAAITPQPAFQAALTQSLGALVQSGAQGTVMTLPLFVTLPYFNAIPYNAIPLDDANQVAALNAAFGTPGNSQFQGVNGAIMAAAGQGFITVEDALARQVSYAIGANPILMLDDDLTDLGPFWDQLVQAQLMTPAQRAGLEPYRQSRPATANDRPVLTAGTVLGTTVGGNPQLINGVTIPVADQFILSAAETQLVVGNRAAFNSTIAGVVAGINQQAGAQVLTLIDVQPDFADIAGLDAQTAAALVNPALIPGSPFPQLPFLNDMAGAAAARADGVQGIEVQGVNLAPDFSPNGIYSVDGIHPNPRGAAIIANRVIEALNSAKNADIPLVNVLALRSIIATE